MAIVYVNDKPVDIGDERINLIQAAQKADVLIPSYCWHPALTVVASCRMCLVEIGERQDDGETRMNPRVAPACQTPAKHNTVVLTDSPKAKHAQEQTLESLLINHPLDCPVCDKAGECLLQDFSYQFGRSESRMIDEKNKPPNKDYIGEQITLFQDRCIMCSRCVRFTREISGSAELQVINRGDHSEIDIFPGEPCNNKLAGNVVDLCPVGALCNKDFLYKQRVWFLKSQKSVCAGCSTGCSTFVDHNKDIVYRIRPRENTQAQGYFICDEGRFDYSYVNARERTQRPIHRRDEGAETAWEKIIPALRADLQNTVAENGAGLTVVLSPFLTCEEAYLLAKYGKELSGEVRLVLGPIPIVGEDDHFPKDRKGNVVEPIKFTIRAEKCPNRRGIEEILRHFQGEVLSFDHALRDGEIRAMYLTGGYPPRLGRILSDEQIAALKTIPLLIVQDLSAGPLAGVARYVLPATTFAEKDGIYVNYAGLAQLVRRAVRPFPEVRTEGQLFMELSERRGLFHAPTMRIEMAEEVPYFAPLASSDLGDLGIRLETD